MSKKSEIQKIVRAKVKVEHHLTHDESMHLRNVVRGGLMMKVVPDDVTEKLVEHGHIIQVLGGLKATDQGQLYDMIYHPSKNQGK